MTAAGRPPYACPVLETTVVVPTYEEAGNVAELLRRIRTAVPTARVLIVDDGSRDGTPEIAEALNSELGGVDVLRRTAKEGLGPAYRAGFARALREGTEVVVTMDADLSHDPATLPMLIAAIEDGADVAVGSRYIPGGSIANWPASRRVLSAWGNRYATSALKLPVSDATSGYRAYRASLVDDVTRAPVRASGYGFLIELAYRVSCEGNKMVEVPITFVDRRWGSSKISIRSIVEAAVLVSLWGARDRVRESVRRRRVGASA